MSGTGTTHYVVFAESDPKKVIQSCPFVSEFCSSHQPPRDPHQDINVILEMEDQRQQREEALLARMEDIVGSIETRMETIRRCRDRDLIGTLGHSISEMIVFLSALDVPDDPMAFNRRCILARRIFVVFVELTLLI